MSQWGILLLQPASPRASRAGARSGIPDSVGAGGSGGRMASAVSAVMRAHACADAPGASLGLCLGQPSTSSHRRQGGDAWLSPAAGMALLWLGGGEAAAAAFWCCCRCQPGRCSSRMGWCRNEPGRGGRGCGYPYAKSIPLGAALWSKRSLFNAQLQLPSSTGHLQSSAAPARSSGSGGWQRQPAYATAPSHRPGGQTPRCRDPGIR